MGPSLQAAGLRDSHGSAPTPLTGDGVHEQMNHSGRLDGFLREASRHVLRHCNALYSNAAPTRCNAAARGSTPACAGRFSPQLFAFRALVSPVGSGSSSHAPRPSRARLEPPLVHAATLLLSASPAMGRPERAPMTDRRRRRRTALAAGSTARGEDKYSNFLPFMRPDAEGARAALASGRGSSDRRAPVATYTLRMARRPHMP